MEESCPLSCNCTKIYKTFIFISRSNVNDKEYDVSIDQELSTLDIDKAYEFSHSLEEKSMSWNNCIDHNLYDITNSIGNALKIIQNDILNKYNAALQGISPDLLSKLKQILDINLNINERLQDIDCNPFDFQFIDVDKMKYSQSMYHEHCRLNEVRATSYIDLILHKMANISNKSLILTSNINMDISTVIIVLWNRLNRKYNNEYIHILPCLRSNDVFETRLPYFQNETKSDQYFKVTNNINMEKIKQFYDNRLKVENEREWIQRRDSLLIYGFLKQFYKERWIFTEIIQLIGIFYCSFPNYNDQDIKHKIKFFCDWVFSIDDDKYDTFIVCAGCQWFREFFTTFLSWSGPSRNYSSPCGVIWFKMFAHIDSEQNQTYQIIESTITDIYGENKYKTLSRKQFPKFRS